MCICNDVCFQNGIGKRAAIIVGKRRAVSRVRIKAYYRRGICNQLTDDSDHDIDSIICPKKT